jgi:hypothetical protein
MEWLVNGAAKRLTFSLLIASTLGGCAVYEPAYPAYSSYPAPAANYYDPYLDSSRAYAAPPAAYTAPPVYVQPPLFFNFGFWGRHGGHHFGGHHGEHHGFHGGGWRGHR